MPMHVLLKGFSREVVVVVVVGFLHRKGRSEGREEGGVSREPTAWLEIFYLR